MRRSSDGWGRVACSARSGRGASPDLRDAGCDPPVKTRRMAQIESTELTAPTHRSAEDRAAAGERGARCLAPLGPRRLRAGRLAPGPGRAPRGPGHHRVPELVPIRYGRMLVSPFTFFRGAAALMAADLADDARDRPRRPALRRRPPRRTSASSPRPTGGSSSHQRLRRDAARARSSGTSSGSRELRGRRPRPRLRRRQRPTITAARRCAPTARRCASSPAMRNLDVWYARLDVDEMLAHAAEPATDASSCSAFERNVAKARTRTACGRSPS